jgi:carbon monoxide dehydrogenase subunit G
VQLENSFTVPLPVDEAWRVLLDIDRIAPCMPGAALDSVTGDDFTGRVKVKLGPINLTYQGKGSFIEKDETTHKAVIDARGKDQRGNGTAAAIVTATLAAEGSVTRVDVLTDLNITGRPAQFGRGVMTDVGNKLLGQFADKLSAQLASGDAGLVDQAAAEQSQEPTVAKTVTTAAATAAATTAGVVEEVAASAEGAGGPAQKAAAAAKKTAAAAADSTAPATTTPAKATPAKATPAKATSAAVPDPTLPPTKSAPAAADTAPTPIGAARKAPSKPPTGTTAPPNRPAGGGPAKSTPSSAPRQLTPTEPEPIDLLEVAGGAAFTRYAAPAAGGAAVLVLLLLVIRRFRR